MYPAPPPLVGEPDYHHVGDVRVARERGFDLGWKDIGAAAHDHVDTAVNEVEETVLVEVSDVAGGAKPVFGRRQWRCPAQIPVSRAHRRPQIDVAVLAGGHRLFIGVQNPDLGVSEAATDAARMSQPLVAAQRGEPQILRHAICRHDLFGAQQLEPGVQQRGRHHRGALQNEDDARQVAPSHVGPCRDAGQHRGRGCEVGDPIAFDHVQNQCRIELFEYHQVVAGQQEEKRREAVGVIHRGGHHDGLWLCHRCPVRHERFTLRGNP